MKRVLGGSVVALAMSVAMADGNVQAADKAATSELPPALLAIGVDDGHVMTTEEADQVRGEGLFGLIGVKARVNVNVRANVNVRGIGGLLGGCCH